MRQRLHTMICAALLLTVMQGAWANSISPEQAKQLASSFLTGKTTVDPQTGHRVPRRAPAQNEIETKVMFDATDSLGHPLIYAVNFKTQGGFVLVSGDDRFADVLGYSDADNFNEQDMPDNMRAWLQGYIDEMNYLTSINYQPSPRRAHASRTAVAPLITTRWSQRSPYNDLCPMDTDSKRSITGCVATAMAQIINYHMQHHNAPTIVIAELPGYTTGSHGLEVATIPAGTVIPDKSLLLDEYDAQATDAQKEAVAQLMLYCGTSVQMDYSSSWSGAGSGIIAQTLTDCFGFDNTAKNVYRSDYSYAAWCNLLYQELDAGRPVIFSATAASKGGHAFVVDAFDGESMFHTNWGWGGNHDGYFALSVMNPYEENQPNANSSGDGYSIGQHAVIGIQINTGETAAPANICMTLFNLRVDGQNAQFAASNLTGDTHSFDYGIGFVEASGEITPIEYSSTDNLCMYCGWDPLSYTVPTNTDYAFMTRKVVPISREQGAETWCSCGNPESNFFLAEYDADGVPHLTVHPIVDLQVSSLSVPSSKYVSEEQTVRLSLTNNGDEYYGTLYLFVSTDETVGEILSQAGITALVGSTQNFTFNWTPETTGTYHLSVALDYQGENVLATSSVTITTDAGIAGKSMVITDVNFEGLNRNSLQIDAVTGVRTYDVYAEELKGTVSIKNISEESITCNLRFLYDEYDELSDQYILDTSDGTTYGNLTCSSGAAYTLAANKESVTVGKTYRVRIYAADLGTDFDDHFVIRLLPASSLYTSTLTEGLNDPAYWSITPENATAGTTIDLTYVGNQKVKSVTLLSSIPYEYSGTIQTFTAPVTGVYELHAWGAQGGKFNENQGGLGGYATCRTNLTAGETIYIYVGGQGSASTPGGGTGGWNGGGLGGAGYATNHTGSAGGGGATHISKVNNQVLGSGSGQCATLAGTDFILVAGGGGGAGHPGSSAGVGGDTEGGLGTNCSASNYAATWYWDTNYSYGKDGGTGISGPWAAEGSGGGGAGFYGGNAHADHTANMDDSGGCGGSSAYNSNLATDFSTTAGQRKGNGRAKIRLVSSLEPQESIQEVTKTSDNHWQYTMPAEDVFVQVAYVTEYASVTSAPTAINGLTFNGEAQALVNAGEAEGGTLYYSLDNYNWNTTIPVAISGSHTVYYKVVGDANHWDYIPSPNMVEVAITDYAGTGTEDDPYLIPSATVWNLFMSKVNNGNVYNGKHFRQTADISVTTMVGTSTNPFKGIYDGAGHTLTVDYNTTEERTAPFRYINGATIKNLHTAGTITTSNHFAGSIAGQAECNNTIINCRASVVITSTVDGDGTHGGVIGLMQGDNANNTVTTIEGCVFDGKLLGSNTNRCGGFVGWCPTEQKVSLALANDLYAPQEVTLNTEWCRTFSRGTQISSLLVLTNCYYTQPLGYAQGKQMYSIIGEPGVLVGIAGAATEYNVSGITSYGTGISYGGVLYAGSGEAVSLNLSGSTDYRASAGTLSGSCNPYTLTMVTDNTTIYGTATVTTAPSANSLTYNGAAQALVNAGTASGGTIYYSLDNNTWSAEIPTATNAADYTVYYKVVGDANHEDFTPLPNMVVVTINKADAIITNSPVAIEGLVFTGAAQTLVSAGSATGGELQYKVDGGSYDTSLPQATAADTYTVWYKVVGDANHNDVEEASFAVTIAGQTNQVLTANQDPNNVGDYYSTFYHSATRYTIPTDVEAYVATISGDALYLTKIAEAGDVLPANTAVILKASGNSITLTPSDADPVTFEATNNLLGVDAATAAPSNCYVLSGHSSDNSVQGVGFYQYTGTLKAHRAYVIIGGGASAPKRLRFVFNNEQTATGIENVQSDKEQSTKVIENGVLYIIRGNVKYNAQGQIVE
ncbi:MAG: C10 family peptidase [Paludibacteraceae bacterium]|nr:C10 family peptidase [Paludibacteraceae bacterium]